ncbi:MAG: Stage III sporulation protein J [Berkelbacteria bacterium GW2011_GWA2_35_9]|uniref:Stage III sporulation protein J n=1 Tax=Berkelbacteria bacterium GW2011_GWA2_35_9 TaxID=1618333 RepID=A0A0G0FLM3_9BACT|nr:MAG: Stage III sporulation protein J [Berkelbacteria bacterium GW2011_GWA2_35_9]
MKYFLKIVLYNPLYNLLIGLTLIIPGHSVGWAIIIITILIRLILLIPSSKSIHQQKKVQEIQPQLAKLKEEYKDDQKKLTQETLALYKKYQINPVGSCLPLLIQLPILIILYQVFIRGLSTASFHNLYSFIPQPESLNTNFFGLDLTKPDVWVLPILAGVSQFFQSWQLQPKNKNQSATNDPSAMMMKQMMYVFPVMTVLICRSLPSALPIYWVVSTLFSIVQQQSILSKKTKEITTNTVVETESNKQVTRKEESFKSKKGSTITIRKKTN